MVRSGIVWMRDRRAGTIVQDEEGYAFRYDEEYLQSEGAEPISLTMPLRREPYLSRTMLPFFDGLIPEGWLLAIARRTWNLPPRDRMGLLLTVCRDCIGAVSITPEEAIDP